MEGKVLKEYLKRSNISRDELAKRLGVSPSAVTQQFNSKDVRSGSVENFCRVMNIKINDLYEGTDLAVIKMPDIVGNNKINEEIIKLKGQVEMLSKILKDIALEKEKGNHTEKKANAI